MSKQHPEISALHRKLIEEGRLRPAKEPGALLRTESTDRGIRAEQIDDAVAELKEDRS